MNESSDNRIASNNPRPAHRSSSDVRKLWRSVAGFCVLEAGALASCLCAPLLLSILPDPDFSATLPFSFGMLGFILGCNIESVMWRAVLNENDQIEGGQLANRGAAYVFPSLVAGIGMLTGSDIIRLIASGLSLLITAILIIRIFRTWSRRQPSGTNS